MDMKDILGSLLNMTVCLSTKEIDYECIVQQMVELMIIVNNNTKYGKFNLFLNEDTYKISDIISYSILQDMQNKLNNKGIILTEEEFNLLKHNILHKVNYCFGMSHNTNTEFIKNIETDPIQIKDFTIQADKTMEDKLSNSIIHLKPSNRLNN